MNRVSTETLNMDLIMGTKRRDEPQSNLLLSPSFPWAPFRYGEQQVSCEGLWGFNCLFKKPSPSIYLGWRRGQMTHETKQRSRTSSRARLCCGHQCVFLNPADPGFPELDSVPSSSSCVWRLLSAGELCSAMSVGDWGHELSGCLLFCCFV